MLVAQIGFQPAVDDCVVDVSLPAARLKPVSTLAPLGLSSLQRLEAIPGRVEGRTHANRHTL